MKKYNLKDCPRCFGSGYYSPCNGYIVIDCMMSCDHIISGTDKEETLDMFAGLFEGNKLTNGLGGGDSNETP